MTGPIVVVAGPPRAGVSSVATALREQLTECVVMEAAEDVGAPAAVVLVASAAAPLTESDCARLESVAHGCDVVVGAVTRIDAHRGWRDVLAEDEATLGVWQPRLADVRWVGVAAAPDVGSPAVGVLVAAVRDALARTSGTPYVDGARDGRRAATQARRAERASRAAAVRHGLQRERLRLSGEVRQRCADLQSELRTSAAELPRGGAVAFEAAVHRRAGVTVGEIDDRVADRLHALADTVGLAPASVSRSTPPDLPAVPPASARRAEGRLSVALGAGFGLGVAMAAGRVLAGVMPAAVGYGVGVLVGCALTVWLVAARGLLGDRAAVERWACEAVAALRWQADAALADAFVDAEAWFTAQLDGPPEGVRGMRSETLRF